MRLQFGNFIAVILLPFPRNLQAVVDQLVALTVELERVKEKIAPLEKLRGYKEEERKLSEAVTIIKVECM